METIGSNSWASATAVKDAGSAKKSKAPFFGRVIDPGVCVRSAQGLTSSGIPAPGRREGGGKEQKKTELEWPEQKKKGESIRINI